MALLSSVVKEMVRVCSSAIDDMPVASLEIELIRLRDRARGKVAEMFDSGSPSWGLQVTTSFTESRESRIREDTCPHRSVIGRNMFSLFMALSLSATASILARKS